MASPTGAPSPEDQRRIEELRQHIQELVDEMAFYQIRWDSLAREGNEDATRELSAFDGAFNELQAEIMDLENQLHELEGKNTGAPAAFTLEKTPEQKKVSEQENKDLIELEKQELDCIEAVDKLQQQEEGGERVHDKLEEMRFRLDYIRREIQAMRSKG